MLCGLNDGHDRKREKQTIASESKIRQVRNLASYKWSLSTNEPSGWAMGTMLPRSASRPHSSPLCSAERRKKLPNHRLSLTCQCWNFFSCLLGKGIRLGCSLCLLNWVRRSLVCGCKMDIFLTKPQSAFDKREKKKENANKIRVHLKLASQFESKYTLNEPWQNFR